MPSQKRRRFQIRQKAKRVEKRRKAIQLSPEEKLRIFREKKMSEKGLYEYSGMRRTLEGVDRAHRKDFTKITLELAKRFPGKKLIILDEGAGQSTFYRDLAESLRGRVNIQVIKTDIQKENRPDFIAAPEELAKLFGKDKFHLIVSTFGGVNYTNISALKAIGNIIAVLARGGEAHLIMNAENYTGISPRLKQLWKRHGNIRVRQTITANSIGHDSLNVERIAITIIKRK